MGCLGGVSGWEYLLGVVVVAVWRVDGWSGVAQMPGRCGSVVLDVVFRCGRCVDVGMFV